MEKINISRSLYKLFRLLRLDGKEITALYLLSILSGLIQLSLPLGIQAIINFAIVATGRNQLPASMWVLILLVVLGVLFTGMLKINQMKIVEKIQQKIFTRFSFEFSYRIPKLNVKSIDQFHLPELVNRFFDIPTLQKSMAKLLLDIPTAVIQLCFGLILLAFYNSVFIVFGIILLVILYLILYISSPKGFEASLQESNFKYDIGGWIQEIARGIKTFKFFNSYNLHIEKTNHLLEGYLHSRNRHFQILKLQYWSLVVFKILITASMLIVGGILLIRQEINIGQFIAAEIIILTIMNAVEKLIVSLETVYDLLTSVEKINKITEKPIDEEGSYEFIKKQGIEIEAKNLSFGFEKNDILQNISFHIKPGQKVAITGDGDSGKTVLLRLLTGVFQNFKGELSFDQIPINNYNLNTLRNHIGIYMQKQDIFSASLWENITLGNADIKEQDVLDVFKIVGLDNFYKSLNKGFDTHLEPTGKQLSSSNVQKLLIARSLLNEPALLLLDEPMKLIAADDKQFLQNYLFSLKNVTIIFTTTDPSLISKSEMVIHLEKGSIKSIQNANASN
ncbi:MAG: ABC transporter ATP-binding protein/permease [Chitinophagaceae bacterium]|nr:ABC transporter ATP-binding protein/permease [Chitinophagaceae bacterium]